MIVKYPSPFHTDHVSESIYNVLLPTAGSAVESAPSEQRENNNLFTSAGILDAHNVHLFQGIQYTRRWIDEMY